MRITSNRRPRHFDYWTESGTMYVWDKVRDFEFVTDNVESFPFVDGDSVAVHFTDDRVVRSMSRIQGVWVDTMGRPIDEPFPRP